MLPAQHRMRRGEDFSAAIRRGARAGSRRLVVHLRPGVAGDNPAPPRVGLVVSRAVGNAVTRNTVKRRLRALLSRRLPDLPNGTLLVVRALAPASGATSAELDRDLGTALSRTGRPRAKNSGDDRGARRS